VDFELEIGDGLEGVAEGTTILLLTAARELLLNVVKHSGALQARLRLTRHGDAVALQVSDEGHGCDPLLRNNNEQHGFGLRSIHERVALLGGTLELDSATRQGFRAVLTVPLEEPGVAERQELIELIGA
jgi:two-component system NarL family sensor kinase